MQTPRPHKGLRHIALMVEPLEACEHFYTTLLGMCIEWKPDADNVYLSSGYDNLALHRTTRSITPNTPQRLDHIGFALSTPEDVDAWYAFLEAHHVKLKVPPKTHRDGARSFYCEDPAGNVVQMIYLPKLI